MDEVNGAPEAGGAEPETAGLWLRRLTDELGGAAVAPAIQAALLHLARDVAHGAERKLAPLASYVAGRHVEARVRDGATEEAALREVSEAVSRVAGAPPPTP